MLSNPQARPCDDLDCWINGQYCGTAGLANTTGKWGFYVFILCNYQASFFLFQNYSRASQSFWIIWLFSECSNIPCKIKSIEDYVTSKHRGQDSPIYPLFKNLRKRCICLNHQIKWNDIRAISIEDNDTSLWKFHRG